MVIPVVVELALSAKYAPWDNILAILLLSLVNLHFCEYKPHFFCLFGFIFINWRANCHLQIHDCTIPFDLGGVDTVHQHPS